MNAGDRWGLFGENWFMSITMTLGSFIAGATSEGGGAVAFPVMTMMFEIPPHVARDFSLMIQAVGMTAAAVTILYTRIPIERRALCWASIGGALGVIIGIEFISPYLPARETKVTFLAIWLAFSFALYWINRAPEREVRTEIESFGPRHSLLLVGTGIIGGAISGMTGSGLDILIFSLLVLRFRISEKIATPTSVILMAINAVVGFLWKANVGGGMSEDAWNYWWVCLPIVVIGAPAGARFIRNRSRLFVARILYVSIIAQFIAGLLIIPQTAGLIGYTAGIFACAMLLFRGMAKGGDKRLSWLNQPGRAG
ncbi:MAG TPA: sulfite exporter TauE/SafE family protein [Myxococcales bacterium]|nr:sulfite exporter TauE/SafE family protein [Myxococcales bacterium]